MGKIAKTAGVLLLSAGLLYGHNIGKNQAQDYVNNNQQFSEEKVDADLAYYGGDTRYVNDRYNLFLFDSPIYAHFAPEKINNEIVVGFKDNISDEYMEEMGDTLDYYNSLFDVINPDYHFVSKRASSLDNCNILVEARPLQRIDQNSVVGAEVRQNFDFINNSKMESANVYINSDYKFDGLTLRFTFAHEMMHILYGSPDVNGYESPTVSVYNSPDVNLIISDFKNPYSALNKDHLDMESFVNIFPVDVATLVAIYGDSSKPENVNNYLKLINDNLEYCKSIYGRQYYFEDGFTLPEPTTQTNEIPINDKSSSAKKNTSQKNEEDYGFQM